MTKPKERTHVGKAKQQFVYFINPQWTSFGAGIDCVNAEEIQVGPNKAFIAMPLVMYSDGFNPMSGVPLMQFVGTAQKYLDDFEIVGGIWVLSPDVRGFFETLDAGAFAFRDCKTQYPDGSPAPPRSLAVVTRVVDAFDRERSEFWPNPYDPEIAVISEMNENYFKQSAVEDLHFFIPAKATGRVLVSQKVKDEFKKRGWKGAAFTKAFVGA